jgi:DNA (cytosine-5)-methyltransferase 1
MRMNAAKKPKRKQDPIADVHKKIDQIRSTLSRQALNLFAVINEASESVELPVNIILSDCGFAPDEIADFVKFSSCFNNAEIEILADQKASLDVIRALIQLSSAHRKEILRRMKAGASFSTEDIQAVSKQLRARFRSDYHHHVRSGLKALVSATGNQASARAKAFRKRARELHRLLESYERRQIEISRLAEETEFIEDSAPILDPEVVRLRDEISRSSATMLAGFEDIFGNQFPAMRDWEDVAIDDPERSELAKAHYALGLLSKEGCAYDLPRFQTDHHFWSATASVNYLAGVRFGKVSRQRFNDRPLTKLNALVLSGGSGTLALGLEAAGFRITHILESDPLRQATIGKNRDDWNVLPIDIRVPEQRNAFTLPRESSLSLIAGELPKRPWGRKGKGTSDSTDMLAPAKALVERLLPRAFFFETAMEFETKSHMPFRTSFIRDLESKGYHITIQTLQGLDIGLVQRRERKIIIGLQGTKPLAVDLSSVSKENQSTADMHIREVAFPRSHKPGISTDEGHSRTDAEIKYDEWRAYWFKTFQGKTVPDVWKLSDKDDTTLVEKWTEAGFKIDVLAHPEPSVEMDTRSTLPLSIPILKGLQSIPDDWEFHGTDEEQAEQIYQATPPRSALVVASAVHSFLTGELIDTAKVRSVKISSNKHRQKKRLMLLGMRDRADPRRYKAQLWREAVDEIAEDRERREQQELYSVQNRNVTQVPPRRPPLVAKRRSIS